MHTYDCNRCGKQFGSPSAVRMHWRKMHVHKTACQYCGAEVSINQMQEHSVNLHQHSCNLPAIYTVPAKTKMRIAKLTDITEGRFWDDPSSRLTRFTAPGTWLKCRVCGQMLSGIHTREQHEKDVHRFTTQIKNSASLRLHPWNILNFLKPSDVIDYVNVDLKSRLGGTPACNDDVNVLVDFFINELPLEVNHVVRGGSYGKGTCLKSHSDLDMVMFVEGLPLFGGTVASSKRLASCLYDVKICLQRSVLATRILITEVTSHSLRFQYKCVKNDHIHHVDLMPCNDILGSNPNAEDKKALYHLIANCKTQHELQLFNACIVQLQVEFVRHRPRIVHDLIRLVKTWKRTSFGEATSLNKYRRLPNSFSLELITIHVWERHGKPVVFELRRGLAAVLFCLMNYEAICVCWYENYSKQCKWLNQTMSGNRPVIVDPANPLNNVCESTNSWDEVAYVARESLKKPLFKEMKSLKTWD